MKRASQKFTRDDLMAIDKADLVNWIAERAAFDFDRTVFRIREESAMRRMSAASVRMLEISEKKRALRPGMGDHERWLKLTDEWDRENAAWDAANAELCEVRKVAV